MSKINIPTSMYNPAYPANGTIIKNIPEAIRYKGEEVINVINLLENKRVSQTLEEVTQLFPDIKSIFIQGNGQLPDGFYNKRGDSWVGIGNFNYLPADASTYSEGQRMTIENKSYELIHTTEHKVWVEKPYFYPLIIFDFFELENISTEQTIPNRGVLDTTVTFKTSNIKKPEDYFLPYVFTSKNSELKTTGYLEIGDKFTFTSTFLKISREYQDGSETVIAGANNAILMFIKDEFENVKIGLAYDKDYQLYLFDKTNKVKIGIQVNENSLYQIGLQYNQGQLSVIIDDNIVYTTSNDVMSDKKLYFSLCNDMSYGQFSNGAAIVGELQIFKEILTPEEHIWIKNNPRTWSFRHTDSYLDLTLDERIKLKQLLK
jgi:hypothetical protein